MSDREESGSDPGPGSETDAEFEPEAGAESTTDPGNSSGDGPEGTRDGGGFGAERPISYLKWAGIAVLAVTALVALFGFYTGVSRAISVWVSRSYRPLVSAAFNLALLLSALGGIGLLLRGRD